MRKDIKSQQIVRAPIRISGVEYANPIGKKIELTLDGQATTKTSILKERAKVGTMINMAFSKPEDAFLYRLAASPTTMFLSGTFDPNINDAKVVPKYRLDMDRANTVHSRATKYVAATKEYLEFRDSPGIISIDIDVRTEGDKHVLWPVEGFPALTTAQEVLNALYEVLPEAVGCPVLVMPSSSSLIEHADTGRILKGPGGWRVLLVTDDALQTPRILRTIHARCWAYGIYRYAFVSRGGTFEDRSLADLALARPTQPDFPTAILGEGLRKSGGSTLMENLSEPYFDPHSVALSADDLRASGAAIDDARALLKPEMVETKKRAKQRSVEKSVELGVPQTVAVRIAERKFEASILLGPEYVHFEGGTSITAADLLGTSGEEFDGRTCLDPIEPEYDGGRMVGKFYWNEGLAPGIHSYAHGSSFFRLMFDMETAMHAIEAADTDSARMVSVLANTDVSDIDFSTLERQVASALSLGNNRQSIRSEVAKERSKIDRHIASIGGSAGEYDQAFQSSNDLNIRLPTMSFPQVDTSGTTVRVIDHRSNLEYMLEAYEIEYRYNVITKEFEWDHPDISREGDNADVGLYSHLVSLASLNGMPINNIDTHLVALGDNKSYNPVTDYLRGLEWDGKPRLNQLANAMDAGNPEVARIALRVFYLQACAAADHAETAISINPQVVAHFEYAIVFVGDQGLGKTIGARTLLPVELQKYFKEGVDLDLKDKDSRTRAITGWIVELGELDATFRKSDISALKAFLSLSRDEIRRPYARKPSQYARRTAFLGTVNDTTFLADETGNRRYLPLTVSRLDIGWSNQEIDQVWAEAWARYYGGENWWPAKDEDEVLRINADRFRVRTAVEEKLEAHYDWGCPPNWTAARRTATEIYEELHKFGTKEASIPNLKTLGTSLTRLWKNSGLAESRGGELCVKNNEDVWIKLNADGGKNRGWLLPPYHKIAARSELNDLIARATGTKVGAAEKEKT